MEQKNSFKFYVSWNDALEKMDEVRVRRFLKNLCNHCEGKEIILTDLLDEVFWSQVQPLLNYNEGLRQKKIANGKKGGLAKVARLSKSSNPKQSVAKVARLSVEDVDDDDVEDEEEVEVEVEDDVVVEEEVEVDKKKMNVQQQEWNNILEKKQSFGWNSFTATEAGRYYELEKEFKNK
jgi:hypothetical protein